MAGLRIVVVRQGLLQEETLVVEKLDEKGLTVSICGAILNPR